MLNLSVVIVLMFKIAPITPISARERNREDTLMGSRATLNIQSKVEKERSPISFATYQIDAATLPAWLTAWGNFKAATDAIIAGTLRAEKVLIYDTFLSSVIPASNFARRELKLLVRYQGDTSGQIYRMEMPCPDLAALTMETGDANFVNLADAGVMAAWVVEFENLARSPEDDTETVTILSVEVVGRNI